MPRALAGAALAVVVVAAPGRATTLVPTPDGRTAVDPTRAERPPLVDGVLDDAVWKTAPLDLPDWVTYNPVSGQKIAQKTEVRVAYDAQAFYVAFHCLDPDPDKVRATLSRRDQLFNDDWVGLSLDAVGNRQQSYDLFVNPRGVQADILNTATAGENLSPDWVWDSAGRATAEGYDVEIRVPWKSIRFASGRDVRMAILFWRRVSRLGMSASWPALPPDKPFFQNHAPLVIHDLPRPLSLEVVPSATYSRSQERTSPGAYAPAEGDSEVGVSVKYGITSTATVEATANPDFSQVESDAFQVEVNQRYPVFYSEKRPFFMEGMGTFELAGVGGDAIMRTAVHTRKIVDPAWGGKAAGSVGRLGFATLAASDTAPGRAPGVEPFLEGREQLFLVGRATWSLGNGSYVGAIGADTELASGHNRVAGADFSLKRGAHTWSGTALSTASRSPDGGEATSGFGGQFLYDYETKRVSAVSQTEHYDRDFRMDTAFLNQTGITSSWAYAQVSFYPDEKKHGWIKRVSPFVYAKVARDRIQKGDETFGLVGVRSNYTRQGSFRLDFAWGQEPWAGREFPRRFVRAMGGAQILRWLGFQGQMQAGRSVYYDETAPFVGPSWSHWLEVTVQPGASFSQSVSWDRAQLDRDEGGRVYRVDLLNLKTTYQFDRRFGLRGILRYDSSRRRVLTDFLASFEPVPGTVAYVGYGSLLERRGWDGAGWLPGQGEYLTTQRGLFLKASYAKRF
jgi:Domain of unknown function (DUF5916)/Carbohydrate family 9 binding domain-like